MDPKLVDALRVISNMPQTQADLNRLAQSAQYAQSPQFQRVLTQLESQAKNFAYVHLALGITTVVIAAATFLVLLRREQREKKRR